MLLRFRQRCSSGKEDFKTYVFPFILFGLYVGVGILFYTNVETKSCSAADAADAADAVAIEEAGSGSGLTDSSGTFVSAASTVDLEGDIASGSGSGYAADATGSGSGSADALLVEDAGCAVVQESNCTESWSPIDALYFAVVTMSTVGYGDYSPSTDGSRLFTIFYLFIGVVCVFSQLTDPVMLVARPVFDWTRMVLRLLIPDPPPIDVNGNGSADFQPPGGARAYYAKNLAGPVLITLALQVVSAACFVRIEGWGFGVALYHSIVTATTVGYGDVSIDSDGGEPRLPTAHASSSSSSSSSRSRPTRAHTHTHTHTHTHRHALPTHRRGASWSPVAPIAPLVCRRSRVRRSGRLFASGHILLSVVLLAAIISDVDSLRQKRRELLHKERALTRSFDRAAIEQMLDELDMDGGGVLKHEFVLGMLLKAGVVEQSDINPYLALFEKADNSGDGVLDKGDLGEAFDEWATSASGAVGTRARAGGDGFGSASRRLASGSGRRLAAAASGLPPSRPPGLPPSRPPALPASTSCHGPNPPCAPLAVPQCGPFALVTTFPTHAISRRRKVAPSPRSSSPTDRSASRRNLMLSQRASCSSGLGGARQPETVQLEQQTRQHAQQMQQMQQAMQQQQQLIMQLVEQQKRQRGDGYGHTAAQWPQWPPQQQQQPAMVPAMPPPALLPLPLPPPGASARLTPMPGFVAAPPAPGCVGVRVSLPPLGASSAPPQPQLRGPL